MWTYVGISGRTQNSVFLQYLESLKAGGIMPCILRTDRGGETPRAADTHFWLSSRLRPDENLTFKHVFQYVQSTGNVRIERWWRTGTEKVLGKWSDTFDVYEAAGIFDTDNLADRIALLAVYMPILRQDHAEFVGDYNRSRIRKQRKRPWVISGIPDILYRYPENTGGQQMGISVPPEMLNGLADDLGGFGEPCLA